MDDLGYRESFSKPKYRRTSRAASLATDAEGLASRFKAMQANMMLNWHPNADAKLEEAQSGTDNSVKYMQCGPSPPAEGAPSTYDSIEKPSSDSSVQICSETIEKNLIDQMNSISGRSRILRDIELSDEKVHKAKISCENIELYMRCLTKKERNILFLWAAFKKRFDLLKGMVNAGGDVTFYDPNGISALHLAAFSNCIESVEFLIGQGANVNLQPSCYTPLHCAAFGNSADAAALLIRNGATIETNTNKLNHEESLLHCAVRANASNCIRLFLNEGAKIHLTNELNAIHLAADLGYTECLEILLESKEADPNVQICLHGNESTALHIAANNGHIECVRLLLRKGADVRLKNYHYFTPLHLAAKKLHLECVEELLKCHDLDPNAEDFDQRTPLHLAVSSKELKDVNNRQIVIGDVLSALLSHKETNVNHQDVYGFTALHLAALEGLTQCVNLLISMNADVSTKSKKGTSALNVIIRKTPACLDMIGCTWDTSIKLTQTDESAHEIALELNFEQLLRHCHPGEISYLNTFVDEGQKEFLEHPLCSAFLYMKWGKIRKYYIARLVFCFITILFLTLYVLTALAHSCYNGSKDMNETLKDQELCQKQSILGDMLRKNPFVIEMQWWVLVVIIIFEIFRKLYGLACYTSVRRYLSQVENLIEWFVIVSVFATSYIYQKRTDIWQNHIAAFAVLLGWTNLMLMIGQLPIFGVYVAMYTKVQGEFAKLFMAYSCMLVGFTISFCVIFPSSPVFSNPLMGFITVLVMMIGEQDLSLLTNAPDGKDPPVLLEISAQITFVLFLLFVTVILMNLLVGIAVHDIQALKKTAELSKLVRQTKLILYIESVLFNRYLPSCIRKFLDNTALISPEGKASILRVKPLNRDEKRLRKDIMMAAYDIAKQHKYLDPTLQNDAQDLHTAQKYKLFGEHVAHTSDSDYGFDTESVGTLSNKIDYNAGKIDELTKEIMELKVALKQNHQVIAQLLVAITNQQNNQLNSN